MLLNEPQTTRAVLILANGQRFVLDTSLPWSSAERVIDLIGPEYFAGYILQPSQKTIEESRKL